MTRNNTMQVIIHTDGACRGNPGPGGWGVVLRWGDKTKTMFGGELHTTNNRMEITAAIRALEALTKSCSVVLHTDSQYLMKGITQWLPQWRKNAGTAGGLARMEGNKRRAVKNADLWEMLSAATARHTVEWKWVRGHANDPGNEQADELANRGADEAESKIAAEADTTTAHPSQ